MISIYKFKDGYYKVGPEGEYKTIFSSWEKVLRYLDYKKVPHPNLGRENPKIRYIDKTLLDYLNE